MHLHAPTCTYMHLHAPTCTYMHLHAPTHSNIPCNKALGAKLILITRLAPDVGGVDGRVAIHVGTLLFMVMNYYEHASGSSTSSKAYNKQHATSSNTYVFVGKLVHANALACVKMGVKNETYRQKMSHTPDHQPHHQQSSHNTLTYPHGRMHRSSPSSPLTRTCPSS